jgi:hypothetical protein
MNVLGMYHTRNLASRDSSFFSLVFLSRQSPSGVRAGDDNVAGSPSAAGTVVPKSNPV